MFEWITWRRSATTGETESVQLRGGRERFPLKLKPVVVLLHVPTPPPHGTTGDTPSVEKWPAVQLFENDPFTQECKKVQLFESDLFTWECLKMSQWERATNSPWKRENASLLHGVWSSSAPLPWQPPPLHMLGTFVRGVPALPGLLFWHSSWMCERKTHKEPEGSDLQVWTLLVKRRRRFMKQRTSAPFLSNLFHAAPTNTLIDLLWKKSAPTNLKGKTFFFFVKSEPKTRFSLFILFCKTFASEAPITVIDSSGRSGSPSSVQLLSKQC